MEEETKEESEDSEKKSILFLYIAVGIIVVIILGFIFVPKLIPEKQEEVIETYGAFEFVNLDGIWFTRIQNDNTSVIYRVPFHYLPQDVLDIPVKGDLKLFLNRVHHEHNSTLYITFDPDQEPLGYVALANGEFSFNIVRVFELMPAPACTKNHSGCESLPIISCDDVLYPVVYFKQAETAMLSAEGRCLIIQGKDTDLVRATDRLLYDWFGITP